MKLHDQTKSIEPTREGSRSGFEPSFPVGEAESDLLRDTVVFHIGSVADALLVQTFAEADSVSGYFAWLDEEPSDDDDDEAQREMASAGLGPEGSLKLVARPRVDEFLGYLSHPEFTAVVSLAFSVADRELMGIHLVSFSGKPVLAMRWLRALRRALTHRQTARSSTLIN